MKKLYASVGILLAFLIACKRDIRQAPSDAPSYRDFEVVVAGEECFILRLADPDKVIEARQLLQDTAPTRFPVGELRRGDGGFNTCGQYHWQWHIDPASVQFVEMAIELCDGRPSFIQERLDYWIDTVRTYCPWSARLVRELP